MSGQAVRGWIAATVMLLVCASCGFKGPLYLPERTGTVVTHPGQPAPSSGQTQPPQTPDAKQKDKIPPAPPPPSSLPPPPQ
jgi:predicted small lipoprotein YifL